MKWIAYYQPMLYEGQESPTRRGFETEEAAWDYIYKNHICAGCVMDIKENEHGIYESNDVENRDNLYRTGCAAEWLVLTEEDFDKADSHSDLMEAAGWKQVYEKPKK